MNPPEGVTWDHTLSPKLGLCTNCVPRHSEPGAQTPLVPTHLPNWAFSFQPPSLPLFFTPFHTCLLLPFRPRHHPSPSTSKNIHRRPFDTHALVHALLPSFAFRPAPAFTSPPSPPPPSPRHAWSSTLPTPPKPTSPSSLPPARSETPKPPWKIAASNLFRSFSWSPLHHFSDLFFVIFTYPLLADIFLIIDTLAPLRPTPPAAFPFTSTPHPSS